MTDVLIVGGGIGGLAAALALARVDQRTQLAERATTFTEVGAGIQLGPNATRVLHGWGLQTALQAVAAFPEAVHARCALSGASLARMPLGETVRTRYGAPYLTIHRADIHSILLQAVRAEGRTQLHTGRPFAAYQLEAQGVSVQGVPLGGARSAALYGQALIGADGLWSEVRAQLLADGLPQASGHVAYRALLPQKMLPASLRSTEVTVWMGPFMHMVTYPVRSGEWLNVVLLVESQCPLPGPGWMHERPAEVVHEDFQLGLRGCCTSVQDLVRQVEHWRAWTLFGRPLVRNAQQMAQGPVALLGDAAHPMLPYLAQGAGMALEDAQVLAQCWISPDVPAHERLQRYAQLRWQRNARVQARAQRNGRIFHAQGVERLARNTALRWMGPQLMDMPWLYEG